MLDDFGWKYRFNQQNCDREFPHLGYIIVQRLSCQLQSTHVKIGYIGLTVVSFSYWFERIRLLDMVKAFFSVDAGGCHIRALIHPPASSHMIITITHKHMVILVFSHHRYRSPTSHLSVGVHLNGSISDDSPQYVCVPTVRVGMLYLIIRTRLDQIPGGRGDSRAQAPPLTQ